MGKGGRKRNLNVWLPLLCLNLGTWPTTQACVLTGYRTWDTLVCRPALNPLSHTSQGHFYNTFFPPNFIVIQVQFSAIFPYPSLIPSPPHLPPFSDPHPTPRCCPCVLYKCSYKPFNLFPWKSLLSLLWSLLAFSQFQCLWLYFACLFVLLIRFLLKVRSYGICLNLGAHQ